MLILHKFFIEHAASNIRMLCVHSSMCRVTFVAFVFEYVNNNTNNVLRSLDSSHN